MDLRTATEVFVKAFSESKSISHPYLATRLDDLWVMQDGPGKKRDPRKIEVVACGTDPARVVQNIREAGLGWHFVCDIQPSGTDIEPRKAAYKELGYRALATEWVFTHDLSELPPIPETQPPVRHVPDEETWMSLPMPRKMRYFGSDRVRPFCIWDENAFYGRVHSMTKGRHGWVADLYVPAEHRRKGYGRALMATLLHSDKEVGLESSVLVASKAGSKLYPLLGYREIGILSIYCPASRG